MFCMYSKKTCYCFKFTAVLPWHAIRCYVTKACFKNKVVKRNETRKVKITQVFKYDLLLEGDRVYMQYCHVLRAAKKCYVTHL